jgi:hypothetical protein
MKYWEAKQKREDLSKEIFDEIGVIFAFSNEQFDRQKKENTVYVSLGGGLILPKENVKTFIEKTEELGQYFCNLVTKECDPIDVIVYELGNYEYCITYDLSDTKEALENFNFSEDQYKEAIDIYLEKCDY